MPGIPAGSPPKVVVTFVIDGGGWNVLQHWPDSWPHLKSLMGTGANYRNAITGSFPAVTACAHASIGTGTFPSQHGITGHNIRDGSKVRKAYGDAGHANPGDILIPTLADLWSDATDNRAWIGEIGYQVWHMGMIGYGGPSRTGDGLPVGVYWDEGAYKQNGVGEWAPHNPDLFRMPSTVPGLDVYDAHLQAFDSPEWDYDVRPEGTSDALLRAARRALPGRPDRGHAPQRADRAERRHGSPLHQLQGAGLHRPHLQHEVAVGGSRPGGGRRAAGTAGRDARRALPERLRRSS